MASSPITSWQIDGEAMETASDFIFLGSKITADGDSSHEIKKTLAPWKKSMTNLLLLLLLLSHFSRFRLCDPIDGSPPGSAIPGIFQARVLEWVAIAFSDDQPRQHIKKQRYYFANKGPSSQRYGFSSSHAQM